MLESLCLHSKHLPNTESFSEPLIASRKIPGEDELGALGSGLMVELLSDCASLLGLHKCPREDERLNHRYY